MKFSIIIRRNFNFKWKRAFNFCSAKYFSYVSLCIFVYFYVCYGIERMIRCYGLFIGDKKVTFDGSRNVKTRSYSYIHIGTVLSFSHTLTLHNQRRLSYLDSVCMRASTMSVCACACQCYQSAI